MSLWSKVLLVSLPLALALTAAFRFIQHTDLEYSQWIRIYGETAARMQARCADLKTPETCAAAEKRTAFVGEFESHRADIMAWWWPALIAMSFAWLAAVVSAAALARRYIDARRTGVDQSKRGKSPD